MYYCCGISSKGIMPHNEDSMLINKRVFGETDATEMAVNVPFIAAVSDGVSGEHSGEIASKLCLEILSTVKYSKKVDLNKKILEIHHALVKYGKQHKSSKNMQTTLCGIAIDEEDYVHTINVGDSRLYKFRGSTLKQVSKDQSLVQMLYEEGRITSEQKRNHSHKNIIFPVIGNVSEDPKPDIQILKDKMENGDLFLICTDGLSDYVTNGEIEDILALPLGLAKRLKKLVDTALEKGGKDNITIIAVCPL